MQYTVTVNVAQKTNLHSQEKLHNVNSFYQSFNASFCIVILLSQIPNEKSLEMILWWGTVHW